MRSMRGARWAAILIGVMTACAPTGHQPSGRTGSAAAAGKVLHAQLRAEAPDFALSGRREVEVTFSVRNTARRLVRLDFPTHQHLEVTLRGPDGRPLFLWSEDRAFAPEASVVVVNPGERLEFEAAIPTRDMVAGRVYTVEAVLPGHPETAASSTLHPR